MADFKHVTKVEWLSKVEKDLKGKPLESLNWDFSDITLGPIYTPQDIENHNPISQDNTWEIGHVVLCGSDYKKANSKTLNALHRGANAIIFDITDPVSNDELQELLKDIQLEWISVHFQLTEDHDVENFANLYYNYCIEKQFELAKIKSTVRTPEAISETAFAVLEKAHISPVFIYYPADSTAIVPSLAYLLEQGTNAIDWLTNNGVAIENCNDKIHFALEVSDNYFINIAMLRAFKLLWQNILSSWGITDTNRVHLEVHVSTLDQVADQNTNKIKAGTQALSAALAGSERIVIHPTAEENSVFSERIALNVHHILQSESYIGQVADPSAGSYYIEHLTDQICGLTWAAFQNSQV